VNQERVRYAKNFEEYWTDAINECKIKEDILVYEAEEARIQDELSRLRHKLSEIQEKVKMQNSKKYNLSAESNPLQLRAHADELGTMLPDWKARKDVKEALRRRLFKGNQIEALVPDKRNEKLTIKGRAQYCAKTGDPYDIWLHALDLIKTKNDSDEEIGDTSSDSDTNPDTEPEPKSQPKNYNPFDVQIAEIDSMLAENAKLDY
ncbi:47_t:CDS:2, partial [Entrophospora sp. SA101]